MAIITGSGGVGSGGTGAGSIAEDMYFADTAARDRFTTDNPDRIYQGVTCAVVNGSAYDYYQYDEPNSTWRDANLIFQGKKGDKGADGTDGVDVTSATIDQTTGHLKIDLSDGKEIDAGNAKGPKGDAGGTLPHKVLDANAYGDMNDPLWLAEGNFIYSFEDPTLSQLKNSPANAYDYGNDPDRPFSIIHGEQTVNTHKGNTYVTRTFIINESDRPKAYSREGFVEDNTFYNCKWQPINGSIVEKLTADGSVQFVPSAFMNMGGGLKTVFSGETATVVSMAPFSEVVDIFDSHTVSDPEDNRTYYYGSSDVGDDHEFWLNLDPSDVADGYTISISVAPVSQSSLTLYLNKAKEIFAPIIPGSTVVIKKLPSTNKFTPFKSSGTVFAGLAESYCDLSFDAWKDLPINSYFVSKGTFANFDSDVNGKQGQIYAQVINTDVKDNPNAMIVHVYTIQSDDDTINGRQYKRVCRVKGEFASAPIVPVGQGGGRNIDPADGFTLDSGKKIILSSGSELRTNQGSDITGVFDNGTHNITQISGNKLIIGSNQNVDLELRSSSSKIKANLLGGGTYNLAIEDETVAGIEAGTNITLDDLGNRQFRINASGTGSDPAEGFTLNQGKSIGATDLSNNKHSVLGFSGGGDFEIGFPTNSHNAFINVQDGLFVNLDGDITKKVLLEGDAPASKGFSVDHTNAGEVVAKDGSEHDAISITDGDGLVFGTRSDTVKSLTLATGATKIDVYRKDADSGQEIVDRVVMASELDQFKGLDDYWVEGAKTDGQILKGTHPETGKETFSNTDDVFMWKYSSYTYMMPLSFVVHKGSVDTQAGVLSYNAQVNRFTLNASGASGSVTDLGWTIGGGASAVKGDDTIPVTYHDLLSGGNLINAGNYALTNAASADLFTFQWSTGTADTVTIPLSIVPENGEFIVSGTGDRVKLIRSSAGYTLSVSSEIDALGFMGHTSGMNAGSTVVNVLKGRGKRTLYLRESEYLITEDDIQHDVIIQAEPFLEDSDGFYSTTVIFPSIDVFTKYYYIPLLNEGDKNTLPHIENLNIQCWLDPETTRQNVEHRLYLKSTGNSVPWGTSTLIGDNDGCFIHRPANDTKRNDFVSFNFMHIHTGSSSTGTMKGYTAQSADEDNVFSLTTTPPVPPHDPTIPELKYIDLDSSYHDLNADVWGTVLADNLPAQDIGYFYLVGKGSSFTNLPDTLTLVADADYSIATEVTKGEDGGFAQRLSIVSPTDTNANNRTIQRAGLNFTAGKDAWAEVMLKRDAIVFDDMTVDVPKTFGTIIAGDNMSGEVVDGILTLSSLPPDQRDEFDILTTRVLKVHEGPDNADKFTEWAVDGNFNTDVHAVGDTHYYSKDKQNGALTEAYQVYEDGKVEFKNGAEFTNGTRIDYQDELGLVLQGDSIYGVDKDGYEHFFVEKNNFNVKSKVIQKVRDGVADDDAVNLSQLKELEAKVTTLTQLIVQQSEHIHSLEESNGVAFGDFDIFSSTPNEVRVDMHKLNGETVSKTIQLGNNPPNVDPTPPDPSDFNVYYGWDINSRALIQPEDILNYESTDERSATLDMQAENLLTTEFSLTREDNSIYKYMYVAYPKDVVDPNPYRVEYSGFVADWLSREVTIDNMIYIVLITELPNIGKSFTIKLHN